MGKPVLSEATRGPARRVITVVALVAVVTALLMTIGMVVVAFAGYSSDVLRICFLVWLVSLGIIFAATRLLRLPEEPPSRGGPET
jgi:pheromone shutdown protein TraB